MVEDHPSSSLIERMNKAKSNQEHCFTIFSIIHPVIMLLSNIQHEIIESRATLEKVVNPVNGSSSFREEIGDGHASSGE